MRDSKLIDSSVWLAYLFNGQYAEIIDSDEIFLLSVLSLFEIKKKLIKNHIERMKITKSIEFIKKRSLIVPLNAEIAEKAVDLSLEYNLAAIDALIYASSLINDATLITLDNDFRGLKGAVVLK